MTFALTVFSILVAMGVGGFASWCMLCGRWPKHPIVENGLCVALAFPLGAGVISLLHFFLLPLGMHTPWLALVLAVALSAIAWPFRGCWRGDDPDAPPVASSGMPHFPWQLALGMFSGVVFIALFLSALSIQREAPHGAWDSWAIWTLRAKFLAAGEPFWRNALDPGFGLSHPEYPLSTSSFIAWGWKLAGDTTPLLPRMVASLYLLSLGGIVLCALTLLRGFTQASLGMLALLSPAALITVSAALYADVPLATTLAASSALLLLSYSTFRGEAYALLAGVLAGLCAWTKIEGLIHLIAIAFAVVVVSFLSPRVGRYARTRLIAFAGGALPLAAFIALFRMVLTPVGVQGLATGSDGLRWLQLADLGRFLEVIRTGIKMLYEMGPWWGHPLLFLLLPLLFLGLRSKALWSAGLYVIGLAWLLICGGYFAVYQLGAAEAGPMMINSLDRLLLHPWPMLVLLVFVSIHSPEDLAIAVDRHEAKQKERRTKSGLAGNTSKDSGPREPGPGRGKGRLA